MTLTVENGNRPALRSLLGKSQVETFATGERTVFLRWSAGMPTKVGIDALNVGDTVTVNVRQIAAPRSSRSRRRPPASSATTAQPGEAHKPLYLFRGTFVSAGRARSRSTSRAATGARCA